MKRLLIILALVLGPLPLLARDTILEGRVALTTNSPAQLAADENDYWIGSSSVFRLTSDAARTITGIDRGFDGRMIWLWNVGAQNILLADQSASSVAKNRIITGDSATATLAAGNLGQLLYDGTTARWRLVAVHKGSSPISGSGTANTVAKFTSTTAVGNSGITDDGTNVTTTKNILIDSDTSQLKLGDSQDLGLARKAANILGVGDGGTSDALRLNAAGRIYGNAVAAITANAGNKRAVTTNVATMTSYIAHNLCAGQTVTIASCGDATYDGTYIIASVPSTTTFTFVKTHADEAETVDAAVTMTASATTILGGVPLAADADADVLIQSTGAGQVPLVVQGYTGQTDGLIECRDSSSNSLFLISATGNVRTYAGIDAAGAVQSNNYVVQEDSSGVCIGTGLKYRWSGDAYGYSAATTHLAQTAAGVLGGGDGTNVEWKIGEGAAAFSVTNTAGVDVTLRARDANGGDRNGGSLVLTPGTNTGTGVIGRVRVTLANCPTYANNAAALAGGLVAGDLYRTGADPDPVCIVH